MFVCRTRGLYELMTSEPAPGAEPFEGGPERLVEGFKGSVTESEMRDTFQGLVSELGKGLAAAPAVTSSRTLAKLGVNAGELNRWFNPARGEAIPAVLVLWAVLASCGESNETLNGMWGSRDSVPEETPAGKAAVQVIAAVSAESNAGEDERMGLVADLWDVFVNARRWLLA